MANFFDYQPLKEKQFMSQLQKYMQGDRVFYTGQAHKQELTRDGKQLAGWIHATVGGQDDSYVVWFPETKESDSYILHSSLLVPYRAPAGKREDGPVIQPRRRKKEDD